MRRQCFYNYLQGELHAELLLRQLPQLRSISLSGREKIRFTFQMAARRYNHRVGDLRGEQLLVHVRVIVDVRAVVLDECRVESGADVARRTRLERLELELVPKLPRGR